jgi:hypothetical protein
MNMYVGEERGLLVLFGKFGSEMGRVEVNGIDRAIESWAEEKVEVHVPVSGTGSSGTVVAFSRDRRSNVRPLTDWRGDFVWTFEEGAFQWAGVIRVHFRVDVHDFREEHRETPDGRNATFLCAADTNGDITASGSDGGTSWSGTSQMKSRLQGAGPNTIDCMGEIDTELKELRLFLFASAQNGMIMQVEGSTYNLPAVWAYGDPGVTLQGGNPLPAMSISLTQTWTVHAGHKWQAPTLPSQELTWGVIVPDPKTVPADSMAR